MLEQEPFMRIKIHHPTTIRIISLTAMLALTLAARGEIILPGTQPEEGGIEFAKVQQCKMCHGQTKNGPADPYFSWQGGMMSQAARDPVFRAALAIANQDIPGVGEFCLRCHAPRGWLEGRSTPSDGTALNREDLFGVSCDLCHRLTDPLSREARGLAKSLPPGYGNAMMVADPANRVRGPYGDGTGAMPHKVMKSAYHATANLCATCHNVSNPLQARDVNTQPPHAYGHIERTYSEWALSDFAEMGREGTCQACHYPVVPGGGQASRFGDLHRDYFVLHGPVGGSTWVQDVTLLLWSSGDMVPGALREGKKRARELLRTAASLDLKKIDGNTVRLRITNKTGHKLPTGYPEGRRMWVNVRFLDSRGELLKEIGRYGRMQETLLGKSMMVPTLLDPTDTRVYECLPGISPEQAARYNKKPGKSFHFILNDMIAKDNRIPPRGFENARFAAHQCQPVGAAYADGQHWDEMDFQAPEGTARVSVRLMYQSVSWEYLKFLARENRTDQWGKRLADAWTKTGYCEPEIVAEASTTMGKNS